MPRRHRAGRLSTLSLALSLSMSGVLAGCGDQVAEGPVPLGGGPGVNPVEREEADLANPGSTDIPVTTEPGTSGTGS